ncbi:MAG: hypothetical protein ACI9YT_001564 [Halobacteriales archaeon]|jgi:hypothetical protein
MDNIQKGMLGVQITLIGLLLGTLFGEVSPYDTVAFVFGIIGTIGFLRSLNLSHAPIHGVIDCIAVNVFR